ncbi:MAG: hypothetical protein ABFS46_21595, partial [Myxococcota bacterium]
CTGESKLCPGDEFEPADTECRAAAGSCDVAEVCNGTGANCPNDALVPQDTVCRPVASDCDVAEACTGTDVGCPAEEFLADGTACNDGDLCTAADVCLTGTCQGVACLNGAFCPTQNVMIDFDDVVAPGSFAAAEPLVDQYAELGATWLGTGAVLDDTAIPEVAGHLPPNFAAYSDVDQLMDDSDTQGYDEMAITCPAMEVSLCVGAEDDSIFTVVAKDADGFLVDAAPSVAISPDVRCVELRGEVGREIAMVEYFNTPLVGPANLAPRFGVDAIRLPEPGEALLLLTALAGVGGLARSRRR